MITTALLFTTLPTYAMELDLQLASDELGALRLTFEDLAPGEARRVEVPCATRRTCRVSVSLSEAGVDLWRVGVTLEEGHGGRRGQERFTLITEPTFVVPTATDAELFQGAQRPIVVDEKLVWVEQGLRLTVRVSPNDPKTR